MVTDAGQLGSAQVDKSWNFVAFCSRKSEFVGQKIGVLLEEVVSCGFVQHLQCSDLDKDLCVFSKSIKLKIEERMTRRGIRWKLILATPNNELSLTRNKEHVF